MKFFDYLIEAALTLKQENQISNIVTKYKKEGKTSDEAKALAYKEVTGEDKEEETVEQKQRALRIRKLVISGYSEEEAIAEVDGKISKETEEKENKEKEKKEQNNNYKYKSSSLISIDGVDTFDVRSDFEAQQINWDKKKETRIKTHAILSSKSIRHTPFSSTKFIGTEIDVPAILETLNKNILTIIKAEATSFKKKIENVGFAKGSSVNSINEAFDVKEELEIIKRKYAVQLSRLKKMKEQEGVTKYRPALRLMKDGLTQEKAFDVLISLLEKYYKLNSLEIQKSVVDKESYKKESIHSFDSLDYLGLAANIVIDPKNWSSDPFKIRPIDFQLHIYFSPTTLLTHKKIESAETIQALAKEYETIYQQTLKSIVIKTIKLLEKNGFKYYNSKEWLEAKELKDYEDKVESEYGVSDIDFDLDDILNTEIDNIDEPKVKEEPKKKEKKEKEEPKSELASLFDML